MKMRVNFRLIAPSILFALALASTVRGQVVIDSIDVGGAWVGSLAYNPLMDVVYGGSQLRDGTFFAIDCATNQVIESWPIQWTMGMDYDSIDHRLYCAYGLDAESLAVIDGRTHQRIKAIPLEWARLCVWDGMRDRLYVSCPERNVVAVFDCTRDSLICEIPVGNYPLKMYLNGQHRKLYVLNYDAATVSIIRMTSNMVIATVPLHSPVGPQSACYSPAAEKFYCDSYEDVTVIDGVTDEVCGHIALPEQSGAVGMSANDELGLVFIGVYNPAASFVYGVDGATDSVISTVSAGDGPIRILASGGSRRTYCVGTWSGDVSVLTYDGARLLKSLAVQSSPFELAYSPASRRLYVSHLNSRMVYVIRDSVTGIEEPLASPQTVAGAVRVRPSVFTHAVTVDCPTEEPVDVFASDGRKVAELQPAGQAPVVWDGCCQDGAEAPPGIYVFVPRSKPGLAVKGVKTMK